MRFLPPIIMGSILLAGCAGNVADYVGPRTGILASQLTRYGLDAETSACVGSRLAGRLTPLQLRRFERVASVVRQGYFNPAVLSVRDLIHVAGSMQDPQVRLELVGAADACNANPETVAAAEAAAEAAAASSTAAAAPPIAWLNLGAATSGQAIAVDASSLEQAGTLRRAWFRLSNPNTPPTGIAYRLNIDCTARTIEPLAHRRMDAAGAVTEFREYAPDEEGPMPIEGGTVMEIAYLALCT